MFNQERDQRFVVSSAVSRQGTPREGARRKFATHAPRRRSGLGGASQARGAGGEGGGGVERK